MAETDLKDLEAKLGHSFAHRTLLIRALTHSSLAYEAAAGDPEAKATDNERLEFLGDAVVGLVVAEYLFSRYPQLQEGPLTRLRSSLVSRKHLAVVAAELGLGSFLRLGKGEERSGGRKKTAILANGMEALIAALYLDAGLPTVRKFIEETVAEPYAAGLYTDLHRNSLLGDHKSALQEYLQSAHQNAPEYQVKGESGPDHRKRFLVEVRLAGTRGRALARGIGSTKKKAEQEAARRALEKLARQPDPVSAEAH